MQALSAKTKDFILQHRKENVRDLALKGSKDNDVDIQEAIIQISGWQIASKKIPSWAATENLLYPRHLSMEQCSSEITSRYKASLVNGENFADLTAGFGVDCSFLARGFKRADYVERQKELCEIARNNFDTLGLNHIRVHNTDGIEYLKEMQPVDCIFIDPARRDGNGDKTVAISDCEPDICALEELLVSKGKTMMVKLSPMLDILSAIRDLKHTKEIHIISVNNECKELLVLLDKSVINDNAKHNHIPLYCCQLRNNQEAEIFRFCYAEEKSADCTYTNTLANYLYEPDAALLKAGAYRLLSSRLNTMQLSANSHLYTSPDLVNFPGRRFKVEGFSSFGKKEIKTLLKDVAQANITVRNFPATVAEIRKRLKLKDGGNIYLFITTLNNGDKVVIKCTKVNTALASE